jgi:hypothetical protein
MGCFDLLSFKTTTFHLLKPNPLRKIITFDFFITYSNILVFTFLWGMRPKPKYHGSGNDVPLILIYSCKFKHILTKLQSLVAK